MSTATRRDRSAVEVDETQRVKMIDLDGVTVRLNDFVQVDDPGELELHGARFRFRYAEPAPSGRLVVYVHEYDGQSYRAGRAFHPERVHPSGHKSNSNSNGNKQAHRNTQPKEEKSTMSTKLAVRLSEIQDLTLDELIAEAKRLKIEGRSKLTRKDDLVKAIKKALTADVRATAAAATDAKPQTNGSTSKAKATSSSKPKKGGETVDEVDGIKAGTKVVVRRDVDLSQRTDGYAGVIAAGTGGKVKELRRAGGGGVQVVVDLDGLGVAAFGVRHLEVAG